MDDWANRFAVIGEDVGAELQKEWEERKRAEEREKTRRLKLRLMQEEKAKRKEIMRNINAARGQIEAYGEIVDVDLRNCFADRGAGHTIGGLYSRDVM
jgi:hypothetical protein